MKIEQDYTKFEVVGAGDIRVSNHDGHKCGGELGFSIGFSWHIHPYTGGVISREEAKRLADFIYDKLNEPKRKTKRPLHNS